MVCVLGRRINGVEHPDFTVASRTRSTRRDYMEFSTTFEKYQRRHEEKFHHIREELGKPTGRVLVHCRNGKDRSPFFVYAFLQLAYGAPDGVARSAVVQARRDPQGNQLVNLEQADQRMKDWLAGALKERRQ